MLLSWRLVMLSVRLGLLEVHRLPSCTVLVVRGMSAVCLLSDSWRRGGSSVRMRCLPPVREEPDRVRVELLCCLSVVRVALVALGFMRLVVPAEAMQGEWECCCCCAWSCCCWPGAPPECGERGKCIGAEQVYWRVDGDAMRLTASMGDGISFRRGSAGELLCQDAFLKNAVRSKRLAVSSRFPTRKPPPGVASVPRFLRERRGSLAKIWNCGARRRLSRKDAACREKRSSSVCTIHTRMHDSVVHALWETAYMLSPG